MRNKRSHRRTAASPPPILSQQLSGPIAATHQHPQSVLAPYQSQHEISFSADQTPTGVSHVQPHPSHAAELFSTHDLRPSRDSQIPFPSCAFDYFLEDQFYSSPQSQSFRSEDDLLGAAHRAWSRLTAEQTETFYTHWSHGLARWRQAMEDLAIRTGEPPRGQRDLGRLDGAPRESDGAPRDRRELEAEEQAGEEKRVASSGFTSIN